MGMKLKPIASGFEATVRSHSLCVFAVKSPPLFEHITVTPCKIIREISLRPKSCYYMSD